VTTLRSAICYISELQKLLTDYDAGMLDPAKYQDENHHHQTNTNNGGRRRPSQKRQGAIGPAAARNLKANSSRRSAGSGKVMTAGNRRSGGVKAAANKVVKQRRVVLRPKWTDYSGSLTLAAADNNQAASAYTSPTPCASSNSSFSPSSFPSSSPPSSSPPSSYVVSAVPYMQTALSPVSPPGGYSPLPPASPRDVNVISLYISLIDNSRD
jgi:hypothetical protein